MSRPHLEYTVAITDPGGRWESIWTTHTGHFRPGTAMQEFVGEWQKVCSVVMPLGVSWPAYAWPGGYEIHYITKDCGVLCHGCANEHLARTLDADDDQFYVIDSDVNYECGSTYCDHCGRKIEPAYGAHDEDD